MKSAYIYVRVSTDEQRRQGYSLIEQEERLLQHCELNHIKVTGIFREDYSAKDFNRPEWKKLIKTIRKNKSKAPDCVLFLKWDRFSRNIEYAYQMIGILKRLDVKAMAIDQPIDFEVPESIVMLAVYLSIPEAENTRRGKNTSDGIRRAKKLGMWPGKAPIGYMNLTAPNGKKSIAPKQPEADHIKWSFQQFATGHYSISEVRRMACLNGLKCGRNNFWRLLHRPVYCGIVTVSATRNEEAQFVKGAHEPLISEELFERVQSILNSRRRHTNKKQSLKDIFPLRGFLICPHCNHTLTGSISQGRSAKYRYYHCCTAKCKGRFKADTLERAYEEQLKNMWIIPEVYDLFKLVLEDENIFTVRKTLLQEREVVMNELAQEKLFISKVRQKFIDEKIDLEDFSNLKQEQKEKLNSLNGRLADFNNKIRICTINSVSEWPYINSNILFSYKNQDITGKRAIIDFLRPSSIHPTTGNLNPLQIHAALAGIISYSR